VRQPAARDLNFSANPTEDGCRVAIRIGPHRFTAGRSEAIELARQIVAAVDELANARQSLISPDGLVPLSAVEVAQQ